MSVIAVTAPTGHVGSRVTRLLIQAGVRPRLLCRSADRLDAGLRELADVHEGDQADAEYVREATVGADALFWLAPEDFTADDPIAKSQAMGQSAAAAVAANGVANVVLLSSVGAEKRQGAGLIDGMARNEEALGQTAENLLILRCGFFFSNLLANLDGLRAGVLTTTKPLDARMPWVDPRDIGDVAAARLLHPDWTGHAVQAVHGPEDLSFERAAEIVSHATGQQIEAQLISDADLRSALLAGGAFSEAAADGMVGMTSGLGEDFVPEQERSPITTTPTSLGAWAFESLRPLLRA